MKTNRNALALTLLVTTLSACGSGGGGNPSTTAAPSGLAYSALDVLELSQVAIPSLTPTYQGVVDTFEISPSLPAGLALDPATGTLSGAANAPTLRTTYTITARNAGGTATANVRIEIAAPQRFAFVTNDADDSTASLSIDSGAARFLRGPIAFSGAADTQLERPVAHPGGRFLYAPHAATNTLVASRIDQANGALDRIAVRPLGPGPHAAAIHPSGAWLCVSNAGADTVRVFAINAISGLPAQAYVFSVGTMPSDLGFSPDGRQLFVTHAGFAADGLGSSLASYAFDGLTGAIAQLSAPLALNGGRPFALAVDPHEPLVYLSLSMFDAVLAVRTNPTGTLTPVPPLRDAGDEPVDLEVDATGRTLYVASAAEDAIRAFRITPSTGVLTSVGSYAAGNEPRALLREPTGERLFALARASGELITYTIGANGALEQESTLAVRPGSNGIVCATGTAPLAWTPGFVQCANEGSDDVHSFRIDAETGDLTFTGQTFTDDQPTCLAVDPRARLAIVVAEGANTVQSFAVSALNGTLAPIGSSIPVSGHPTNVAIDAAGRFAYVVAYDVVTSGDGRLMTFAIDSAGVLALVDTRVAGSSSRAVAVEPTGEFVYVANAGDGTPGSATIAAFRVNATTGIPTPVGTPVSAPGIVALAFHPDGKTVYAVLRGTDALGRYAIDRASGGLTAVPQVSGPTLEPAALALDPRGDFAWASYTGNAASGELATYPVLDGGELGSVVQQVVDGQWPASLALEASGRYLFAANRTSHDISVLAVDPATGFLTVRAPVGAGTTPTAIVASATTH